MPLRLKGSHHVNIPTGVDKIFSLISVFLNEKAKKRVGIINFSNSIIGKCVDRTKNASFGVIIKLFRAHVLLTS